jgi:hypothetical protein
MPDELVASASLDLPNKPSLNSLLPRILHDFPATSCYAMVAASNIRHCTCSSQATRSAHAPTVLEHFLRNESARWGDGAIDFTV